MASLDAEYKTSKGMDIVQPRDTGFSVAHQSFLLKRFAHVIKGQDCQWHLSPSSHKDFVTGWLNSELLSPVRSAELLAQVLCERSKLRDIQDRLAGWAFQIYHLVFIRG